MVVKPKNDNFDIEGKYKETYETIDRPEKFAELFCKVAESQTNIQDFLKKFVINFTKENPEFKKELRQLIKDEFKKDYRAWLRTTAGKIGFAIWTILIIILTTLISKWFE